MQTQPVEDIDAVLGRFQAWAGSRNAGEAKAGIRELSYEEALRSRRYRWKGEDSSSAKKKLGPKPGPEPGVVPVAAPDVAPKAQTERVKTAPAKARDAKRRAAKQVRAGNHVAKTASPAKVEPAAKTKSAPEFREALANAVRPAEVIVSAQPVELARQVAISIRLAPSERALVKTRAAEAGISASAYIRQCTLEVEQLRAQVQQALAAMERGQASVPAPVSAPGFFARWVRKIFSGRSAPLALRA